MSVPLEHDYIGLSEAMEKPSSESHNNNTLPLNLKATELRLGLPGLSQDTFVSGAKRPFSDASSSSTSTSTSTSLPFQSIPHPHPALDKKNENCRPPPPAKAQVVGWPPIRSFRKNTMATNVSKNGEGKSGCVGCLYVKVSMDGAPYLRKVDLKTCKNYTHLSNALEKMFGQCTSNGLRGQEGPCESNLKDLLKRDECVLTYEDKDGDWMLVGDVPWEMFVDSCKRLRIMKGSEAIGLAPRSMEKCKNQIRGGI